MADDRTPDNRTLVALFLRGGLDGLNAVIPTFEDRYHEQRPRLRIDKRKAGDTSAERGIPLDDRFALNPNLEAILPAYREGRLAVLHAVGSDDDTRSHFEAQDQMDHGASAHEPLAGGWLARWLRTRDDAGALSALAIGTVVPESLRGAPSVNAVRSIDEIRLETHEDRQDRFSAAVGSLYSTAEASNGLDVAGRDALGLLQRIRDIGKDGKSDAEYPDTQLAHGLSQIARLVRSDVGLRAAAIDQGGYDTHFGQRALLPGQLSDLGGALAAFDQDLGSHRERVTLVCITEFGRRVYENTALGTDHGRGSCAFVLGGGVQGGKVAGDWPGLDPEAVEGPGDLHVTTDYRSLLWEVLSKRFGASDTESVFPGFEPSAVGIMA